jgi:hypothetical protein
MINIQTINGTQIDDTTKLFCESLPRWEKLSKRSQEVVFELLREEIAKHLRQSGFVVIDFHAVTKKVLDDLGCDSWSFRDVVGVLWDMPHLFRIQKMARNEELSFDHLDAQLEAVLGS